MNDEPQSDVAEEESFLGQHRYFILIGLTIIVSLALVSISLTIYNVSGAAQLDLSRPGYKSVVSQAVDGSTSFQTYASSGSVNSATISQFQKLYDKQAQSVTTVDAFGGDPLNPDSLEFDATTN